MKERTVKIRSNLEESKDSGNLKDDDIEHDKA